MKQSKIYFELMWFWCWICYRAYMVLPMPRTWRSVYGSINGWILGYAGAYANSERADFHLCNFFYSSKHDQDAAWVKHIGRVP